MEFVFYKQYFLPTFIKTRKRQKTVQGIVNGFLLFFFVKAKQIAISKTDPSYLETSADIRTFANTKQLNLSFPLTAAIWLICESFDVIQT